MARKVGLGRDDVLSTALALVDASGLDALSLKAVADRLGVRPPSLYSHVDGLAGLREALTVESRRQFAEVLRDSVLGRSGDAAVISFARAYRRWATDNPARYELTLLPSDSDEARRAGMAAIRAMDATLSGYGLAGVEATRAGRSLRAALHGFSSLEVADGLGRGPHDDSFEYLIRTLIDGLHAASDTTPSARLVGSRERIEGA